MESINDESLRDPEGQDILTGLRYALWLTEMSALAPEALEWDEAIVEQFVAQLQNLAVDRRLARTQGVRQVEVALVALIAETGIELHFFDEFDQLDSWSAEHCPPALASEARARIETLHRTIVAYRELKAGPPSDNTRAAHKLWRQQLDEREAEIIEQGLWLQKCLTLPTQGSGSHPDTELLGAKLEAYELPGESISNTPVDRDADHLKTPEALVEPDVAPEELPRSVANSEPETAFIAAMLGESGLPDEIEDQLEDSTSSETDTPTSALQIAAQAIDSTDPQSWSRLLWLLVEAGDLAGAYWLTRSLQAQNKQVDIPSWLLRALQYARWVGNPNDAYGDNLREALYEGEPVGAAQELLRLAACLKLSILAPGSVPNHYLVAPGICPELMNLIGAIQRFQNVGVFPGEELRGDARPQRAQQIKNVCRHVREFLAEASQTRFNYVPTNRIWSNLLSPRSDLGAALRVIADDRRERLDDVLKVLLSLRNSAMINQRIIRAELPLGFRPIMGPARNQLVRKIETTVKIAEPWCQLVGRERELARVGGHVHEYIASLRQSFKQDYSISTQSLETLRIESDDLAIKTASVCLLQTLAEIRSILGLGEKGAQLGSNAFAWLTRDVKHPDEALSRRLFWLPEIATEADGTPSTDSVPQIAPVLVASLLEGRDLETVVAAWLERENYTIADVLIAQASGEQRQELQRTLRTRLRGTQNRLRDENTKLTEDVEQAFADEYISSERRATYTAILANVSRNVEQSIPTAQALLQSVHEELNSARTRHLETLRVRWYALRNQMESQDVPLDAQTRVVDAIEGALDQNEVRLAESYLNHLDTMLSLESHLDLSWLDAPTRRDYLGEFLTLLGRISIGDERERFQHADAHMLLRETNSVGGGQAGANLRTCWERIGEPAGGGQHLTRAIGDFLVALGFRPNTKGQTVELRSIQLNRHPRWAHAQARMSLGDLSRPLAQFGSAVQNDKGSLYDIFCVWDKVSVREFADELIALPLRNRSAILCYFGILPARTRRELRRLGQQANLAFLVVDDTLIAFLSQCGVDPVFPALLYSAAPFSTIMPYYPFSAGGVPREVFFGREELRNSILDPHGTCIIYGGRQMGKSALLVNARDRFHNPSRGHYACVIDIKLIGDFHSGNPTGQLWRYIFDFLKNERLVEPGTRYKSPEQIQQCIRELTQQQGHHLIIMFDEADNFLIADAMHNFQVVEGLRLLMFETNRRFKAVFAGLHNVQRFTNIPNQPFAHFATPRSVGSLEPVIARELVREPLEAIGYRFASDTDILRILSYTNYHPGLIQLFCSELVRQLQVSQGASGDPPYVIGRGVVESVYRQSQVLNAIRARFDWTLALDAAYQAIVWCIVDAEHQENNEPRIDDNAIAMNTTRSEAFEEGSYDTLTLLRLIRQRLPKGFANVAADQLRSLLDELKGLGVLLQTADGRFRLSTPNIANLFADDVDQRLQTLGERANLLDGPDFDRYHRLIHADTSTYSPLTYAQERLMYWHDSGVSIVLGSKALGLDIVQVAAEALTVNTEYYQVDHFQPIPNEILRNEKLLRSWLERIEDDLRRHHHIVFFAEMAGDIAQLEAIVDSAVLYCHKVREQGQQRIHIVFAALPELSWLICLQPELLVQWERSLNKVAWLQLWSNEAIQSRFGSSSPAMVEKNKTTIATATGGWHLLLDELHRRWNQENNLDHALRTLAHDLETPESDLARHFRDALGIVSNTVASAILHFIAQEGTNGTIERELVTVELIDDPIIANEEQCQVTLEYLMYMNCLQNRDGTLVIDPLVRLVL